MRLPRTVVFALALALALALAACPGSAPQKAGPDPVIPNNGDDTVEPQTATPPAAPTLKLDAALAAPVSYAAQLSIDASGDAFDGLITIDVELRKPSRYLWLNATGIEVDKASYRATGGSGGDVQVSRADEDFIALDLGAEAAPGRYQLELSYSAKIREGRAYDGVFTQTEDKRHYLYTQFEATGARMAFPCFDQPEFKTPWTLKITAPKGQLAFANTPEVKTEDLGEKTAYSFATSKPIPSYLVAFAVGPFEIVDIGVGGRNKTPMRIIVPRGRKHQTAHAAKNMPVVLDRLESYFDMGYPYAKLDSIALPHFFGAMENPGLITYAASILLIEPGTESDQFLRGHLNVVAHELAHQWFGNLVTLRWWDDLWLNESFASWMAAKIVDQMRPAWEGAVTRVETRDASMEGDSRDSTRPVRKVIKDKDDILGIFDAGITYGKGSSVIAMFEAWIGDEKFRSGMREYMRTHAWKTTTAADFFASLAKVSDDALPKAFATFIDQSGVPLISAKLECRKGLAALDLEQSRYVPTGSKSKADSRSWKIPVCVKYGVRDKEYRTCKLMEGATARLDVGDASACPSWVVANADSTGYYRVSYQGDLLSRLMRANKKLTTADRIGVIGDVEALMASGQVKVADALGLIPRLIKDRNAKIVQSAAQIAEAIGPQVPDASWARYQRFIKRTFGRRARQLGFSARRGETDATRALRRSLVRLVALTGEDRKLLRQAGPLAKKWLADPKSLDADMLGITLRSAARTGDAALYDAILAQAGKTKDQRTRARIIGALAEFRDRSLTDRTLKLLLGDDLPLRATFGLLQRLLGSRDTREQTYRFIVDNLDKLSGKLPAMARGFLTLAAVPFCDDAHKADIDKIFAAKLAGAPGIDRALKQAREEIDMCMARQANQQPQIEAFLRRY